MVPVRSLAVEGEPDLLCGAIRPRLDPHHEFAREEAAPPLVEQDGVDPIAIGEVHARGDEDVIPSVGVEVVHARRSEEHTSELQSLAYLVCRLLLEKKKMSD